MSTDLLVSRSTGGVHEVGAEDHQGSREGNGTGEKFGIREYLSVQEGLDDGPSKEQLGGYVRLPES